MSPAEPADTEIDALASELVDRCIGPLRPRSWHQRLEALGEMHDQLREDIPDLERFCTVFPAFIARLIERFGSAQIDSLEQAQIYANSDDPAHRDAAGAWLRAHGQPGV